MVRVIVVSRIIANFERVILSICLARDMLLRFVPF